MLSATERFDVQQVPLTGLAELTTHDLKCPAMTSVIGGGGGGEGLSLLLEVFCKKQPWPAHSLLKA